jgi:hypothetical protein
MSETHRREWLTFHWPNERRFSFLLPGFVALSAFAHALMFYVFQVIYPPTVSITPPPVQAEFIAPEAANSVLFRWIEAEDPAIAASAPDLITRGLLELPYRPSYLEARTFPKPAAPPTLGVEFPPAESALNLVQRELAPKRSPLRNVTPAGTNLRIGGALAGRKLARPLKPVITHGTLLLQPAAFLIGVNSFGEIQYLFLQDGSGDPEMDRKAEEGLAEASLDAAPGTGLTWGTATFVWGPDAYPAAAHSPRLTAEPGPGR